MMSQKPLTSKPRPATTTGGAKPRTKFSPRAPASTPDRLKKLHAGLVDQINEGYLENAIKTCRKILVLDPRSLPAFKTLLFLLLQTDQYPTALASFDEYGHTTAGPTTDVSDPSTSFDFERAYCLYRLHRGEEALKMIQQMESAGSDGMGYETERGRKVGHLKGQILYRAGKYESAEETYDHLLSTCPSDSPESGDILDNLNSTHTHLEFQRTGFMSQLPSQVDVEALERDTPGVGGGRKSGQPGSGGVMGEEASSSKLHVGTGNQASGSGSAGKKEKQGREGVKGSGSGSGEKRTRHKLPRGVVKGKDVEQDPDRWLPLQQRRSYQAQLAQNPSSGQHKKKRANHKQSAPGREVSGLGTQGSTSEDVRVGGGPTAGGAGGGAKGKKGRKGR